ncbi:MAG TPA: serine--tRNA ligase [Candidatus Saccharimonadales bacterium]|nr:serine--tRNA ligase [Candidatus Saccharimonadales bacterium]
MLEISLVRDQFDLVKERLATRAGDIDFSAFGEIDAERRSLLREAEALKARKNKASQEVGRLKKSGEDAGDLIREMREVGDRIKELDARSREVDERLAGFMLTLPNLPHESVPVGRSADDNTVVRTWGEAPRFDYEPRPHWELGDGLGILDFERAAKLAGSRFAILSGAGARLERALINFMLDVHTRENGYRETMPPYIVNSRTLTGTGQLPKFKEDLFKLEGTDYWLIPTAEVPVTNIHGGEVLEAENLPKRFVAYTPCFRSEAGSYGKDVRGLMRQHQFNKVELVALSRPESSYEELERMTSNAEGILQRLGIHYRVVTLCTGDMGFSAAKTYDIEVWLPSENTFREISSVSNCEAFQARRAGIRFREPGKKGTTLVHTLNGSGLAVGRTLIAVLENYQQRDGSVVIPEALRPFMDGAGRIERG